MSGGVIEVVGKYVQNEYIRNGDIPKRILKNPRKHRDMPQKYIVNGTERGVNQNPPKLSEIGSLRGELK